MPGCSASACNRCERLRLNSPLCMPRRETVRESRMREICMSGLKRAGAAGLPVPPLLYCLSFAAHTAMSLAGESPAAGIGCLPV